MKEILGSPPCRDLEPVSSRCDETKQQVVFCQVCFYLKRCFVPCPPFPSLTASSGRKFLIFCVFCGVFFFFSCWSESTQERPSQLWSKGGSRTAHSWAGVKNISMRGSELWDWLGCLCSSDLWNPPDLLHKSAVFKESKLSAFTNESVTWKHFLCTGRCLKVST